MNFVKKFLIGRRIKSRVKTIREIKILRKVRVLLLLTLDFSVKL